MEYKEVKTLGQWNNLRETPHQNNLYITVKIPQGKITIENESFNCNNVVITILSTDVTVEFIDMPNLYNLEICVSKESTNIDDFLDEEFIENPSQGYHIGIKECSGGYWRVCYYESTSTFTFEKISQR